MARMHHWRPMKATGALTPMIDIVFLLIIFFMLVAQFSRQEAVALELPRLEEVGADGETVEGTLVINVIPSAQRTNDSEIYRIGTLTFGADTAERERMIQTLEGVRQRRGAVPVRIRADRLEHYEYVQPAMEALGAAGFQQIELMMTPEDDQR